MDLGPLIGKCIQSIHTFRVRKLVIYLVGCYGVCHKVNCKHSIRVWIWSLLPIIVCRRRQNLVSSTTLFTISMVASSSRPILLQKLSLNGIQPLQILQLPRFLLNHFLGYLRLLSLEVLRQFGLQGHRVFILEVDGLVFWMALVCPFKFNFLLVIHFFQYPFLIN